MAYPTVQTPTIRVGTRLTDYTTLDLTVEGLATGGMGLVVWGKNAAESDQMLALKLLKPERLAAAQSPERRQAIERQFEDEALVWCHLWYHDCVITTTGLTRLPDMADLPVLLLDYAPNGSLRDQLRIARLHHSYLPLRAALAWAIHIAAALAHIHQPDAAHDRRGPLVHCDLKPENVLLNAHNWAQLTDLGLTRAYAALAADAEATTPDQNEASPATFSASDPVGLTPHQAEVARLRAILQDAGALPPRAMPVPDPATLFATRTLRIPSRMAALAVSDDAASGVIGARGPVAGSPPYMAPEQWQGLKAAVPATDLYAFGVLLFELFAGSETPHPFPHDPTPYLTPELYAHALATGYDPLLLAWHAAHTAHSSAATAASSGRVNRLTDPDVAAAALQTGPIADLVHGGDAASRAAADVTLRRLDALIGGCLAPNPAARPSAATVQQELTALVADPCGLKPIQTPTPLSTTPQTEAAFWGNLAKTYSMLARHEEAIAAQHRALDHDPTDPVSLLKLGAVLGELGNHERSQAAEAEASGRPAHEVAALSASSRQHYEEELDSYRRAESHLTPEVLARLPSLPAMIAANQGSTFASLGRYDEAVAVERRALVLQPDWHDTRFNLALHYARWSQVQSATLAERLDRLQAAATEISAVLAATPTMRGGRALAERIARALADPAHHFQG